MCVANLEVVLGRYRGRVPKSLGADVGRIDLHPVRLAGRPEVWNGRGHASIFARSITFSAIVRRLAPSRAAIGTMNRAAKSGRLRGSWPLRFNAAGRR